MPPPPDSSSGVGGNPSAGLPGPVLRLVATPGRLDSVLSGLSGVSRSQVAQWVSGGLVRVDGELALRASLKLRGGELLMAEPPALEAARVEAEQVPLEVLYEDEAVIAVNKPPGMITHPAPGVSGGTLVNALLGRMDLPEQPGASLEGNYRPGIVHRLDKETSGVIVVAKTVGDHARLAAAFKDRETRKTYLALAAGRWPALEPAWVDAPVGRHPVARQRMTVGGVLPREAQTLFTPLARLRDPHGRVLALSEARPRTGRTHQIRVHLQHLGSPLLGDRVYGRPSEAIGRQALHAWALDLPHPRTGEPLHLYAPAPDDLLAAWVSLGGELPQGILDDPGAQINV